MAAVNVAGKAEYFPAEDDSVKGLREFYPSVPQMNLGMFSSSIKGVSSLLMEILSIVFNKPVYV